MTFNHESEDIWIVGMFYLVFTFFSPTITFNGPAVFLFFEGQSAR